MDSTPTTSDEPTPATRSLTIRTLAREDWALAFRHGDAFFAHRGLSGAYSMERALRTWTLLSDVSVTTLLVGEREAGTIVGGIGMVIIQDEWAEWTYGSEGFFFLVEKTPGLAVSLMRAGEAWVHAQGVSDCRMAAYHQDDFPLVERFYRQQGYRPYSTIFRREG